MLRFCNLSVTILLLCTVGTHTYAKKRVVDKTIVTVNGDIILQSDVKKFRKKLDSKGFLELFGGVKPDILKNEEAVLQLMVEEKIINQQVKKLQLEATPDQIDGQIKGILKRNGITRDQLAKRLSQLGTTMSQYEDGIKRQIERRNLVEREIKPSLEISNDQLKRFYKREYGTKTTNARYKIAHILISKGGKKRADTVYEMVNKTPKDFEKLAKQYSDDETNSQSGGSLGTFALSEMSDFFKKNVPGIPVGGFSKPVKTSMGYHIIKVVSKSDGGFDSLPENEKLMVKNQMLAKEVERLMALWLERKKRESYIRRSKSI